MSEPIVICHEEVVRLYGLPSECAALFIQLKAYASGFDEELGLPNPRFVISARELTVMCLGDWPTAERLLDILSHQQLLSCWSEEDVVTDDSTFTLYFNHPVTAAA